MDGFVVLVIVVYFVYVSRNWYYIILYAATTNFIFLLIGIWFLPESPKWLYDKKRYSECIKVIMMMAK